MIPALERDGWSEVALVGGSHRQFIHLRKRGRVTVPGTLDDELAPGTLASIRRVASLPLPRGRVMATAPGRSTLGYAVIVEPTRTGFSAYVPNLPACVTTGRTLAEIKRHMAEAIALHLAGMRADGAQIPKAAATAAILVVPRAILTRPRCAWRQPEATGAEASVAAARVRPVQRRGAAAIPFLCSDDASYVSGHALVVDRGQMAL